jgi:ADP-ribosylglycohydrolase
MLKTCLNSQQSTFEIISRRGFLRKMSRGITAFSIFPFLMNIDSSKAYAAIESDVLRDRIEAMLLGSLIGDAAGGPVEFCNPEEITSYMPATRNWAHDRKLNSDAITKLADSFQLLSYEKLRPDAAPYGQWSVKAPPGTITDDSRLKIILFNTLRQARDKKTFPINSRDLAQQFLDFEKTAAIQHRPAYQKLCEKSLRELIKSARWVLGERKLSAALPPERLWGGVATNVGQMVLLPLSALYPGRPSDAYLATYHLGFFDNGPAKDINSAAVAGLAAALTTPVNDSNQMSAWNHVIETMKKTDPYQYSKIPWVGKPTVHWLDFAHSAVERANNKPKRLFEILENEGKPYYWWDAHFIFASAFAILEFCRFNGLASLHLALDFGHDTDSAAQLIGAFVGAMYGTKVFPEKMRLQVTTQLQKDYDQSLCEWVELLLSLNKTQQFPELIKFS